VSCPRNPAMIMLLGYCRPCALVKFAAKLMKTIRVLGLALSNGIFDFASATAVRRPDVDADNVSVTAA
jgi:hypothetical protein